MLVEHKSSTRSDWSKNKTELSETESEEYTLRVNINTHNYLKQKI